MFFKAKVDRSFVTFISIILFIITFSCLFPLFLEGGTELAVILTLLITLIITSGLILWSVSKIEYFFQEDHLFIIGGPFRSRIPYEDIIKVKPTKNIYTGFRILSSKDAIEIVYPTGVLGSVKISPKEKDAFLQELRRRCPKADFQL